MHHIARGSLDCLRVRACTLPCLAQVDGSALGQHMEVGAVQPLQQATCLTDAHTVQVTASDSFQLWQQRSLPIRKRLPG